MQTLFGYKRILVKIGSALLVDQDTGQLRQEWLRTVVDDLVLLKTKGADVFVVSSGSIALGREKIRIKKPLLRLEESQALAAVGQIELARAWRNIFDEKEIIAAQILLTLSDTEERRRYLNARSTLETLFRMGAVPIINENDTVATSEIRYGDNDRLAARVASMASADCVVLLSDIDGLYSAPPNQVPEVYHIPVVKNITLDIESMAGDEGSELSRGGMKSKIEAAKIATAAGADMIIASGKLMHPLMAIEKGARCTWFFASTSPKAARKNWIAGSLEPKGVIVVDAGAMYALKKGKSLLPAGVIAALGQFERGECVWVEGPNGVKLARGLVAYDINDVRQLIGCHSKDIVDRVGFVGRDTIIHRDDLAMLDIIKAK